jgi:uncharacterized protein with HEPN domain
MPRRDDSLRLLDMLSAAREARLFVAGKSEADVRKDRVLTLALLKCVELIGEAAARIGEDTRAQYPHVPWADIVGMRNRLVHAYFDVDLSLLWTTVADDLPELIASLEAVVESKPAS